MCGIDSADTGSLALHIALWDNTSLWNIAWGKIQNLWEEKDVIKAELDASVEKLRDRDAVTLRLMSLFRLCSHMNIALPSHITVGALEEIGGEVESRAITLVKTCDKTFNGTTTHDLVAHILQRMFGDLQKKFATQDATTQREIVEQILSSIRAMPEAQREALKKQLGISEFSEAAIRKAIISGSLGAAFAVLIKMTDFAGYLFAAKALAAVAGLSGITLPFAAYTMLTSAIAFVANPFVLVPAALGLGWWLTTKTNRKIKNGFVPFAVMQAVVSSVTDVDETKALREFVTAYNATVKSYQALRSAEKRSQYETSFPGIASVGV